MSITPEHIASLSPTKRALLAIEADSCVYFGDCEPNPVSESKGSASHLRPAK
jgi:hypothetical protein